VWRRKNNIPAFVEIIDVSLLDQAGSESISLFDVMTKMSIFNIYSEFDWGLIQDYIGLTENKFQKKCIDY